MNAVHASYGCNIKKISSEFIDSYAVHAFLSKFFPVKLI